MRVVLISFCLLLLQVRVLPTCALGQEQKITDKSKATISGTVSDKTGAVLGGAQVMLSNSSGVQLASVTDEKGGTHSRDSRRDRTACR